MPEQLSPDRIDEIERLEKLGEGGRSSVYSARWNGRIVALKIYKPQAIEHHQRKHGENIARYEYDRNLAFYSVPGLQRYVARPLGLLAEPESSLMLQEKLDGELYYFHYKKNGSREPAGFREHLRKILELSHAAGLYDVDMHAMNIMAVPDGQGGILPKLFDFNLVPFSDRPRNPFVALALKLGLMDARSRDLRKLEGLHDFARYEKALLHYYES